MPTLNLATFFSATLISAPVRGLRAVVAARLETEKAPKPTRRISSPFFRAAVTEAMNAPELYRRQPLSYLEARVQNIDELVSKAAVYEESCSDEEKDRR